MAMQRDRVNNSCKYEIEFVQHRETFLNSGCLFGRIPLRTVPLPGSLKYADCQAETAVLSNHQPLLSNLRGRVPWLLRESDPYHDYGRACHTFGSTGQHIADDRDGNLRRRQQEDADR